MRSRLGEARSGSRSPAGLETVPIELPMGAVLFGGGIDLLVGSWTGAPLMTKALAQDYFSLSPRRSIAPLIPSFV